MAESEKKKKNNGCLGCLAVLGVISLTAGIYLLNQWDTSGAGIRTASVILTTLGVMMILPAVVALTILVVVYLFLKKLGKGLEGVNEAAEEMVAQNKKMYSEIHTFRAADGDDFEGLDDGWYETTKVSLEGLGFRHLGDLVDETIEENNGMVTPIRVFTSADGTTSVAIYHFVMPGMVGGASGDKLLMVDVTTEFSDDTFVMTSNTAEHDQTTSPPKMVKIKLPLATSVEQLLAAHVAERGLYEVRHPGVLPVALNTLEELIESEKRQQKIKNDFRQAIGFVDPEEVKRIGEQAQISSMITDMLAEAAKSPEQKNRERGGR